MYYLRLKSLRADITSINCEDIHVLMVLNELRSPSFYSDVGFSLAHYRILTKRSRCEFSNCLGQPPPFSAVTEFGTPLGNHQRLRRLRCSDLQILSLPSTSLPLSHSPRLDFLYLLISLFFLSPPSPCNVVSPFCLALHFNIHT